jgi:hypothetical protein
MMKVLGILLLLGLSACDGLPFGSEERQATGGCEIVGCSSEMCADPKEGLGGTCEWRDSYACFDSATCERQSDGKCGWTQTEALQACLSDAE